MVGYPEVIGQDCTLSLLSRSDLRKGLLLVNSTCLMDIFGPEKMSHAAPAKIFLGILVRIVAPTHRSIGRLLGSTRTEAWWASKDCSAGYDPAPVKSAGAPTLLVVDPAFLKDLRWCLAL
jgi:hypothetical protein